MKNYILNIVAGTVLLFAFQPSLSAQSVRGFVRSGPDGQGLNGITVYVKEYPSYSTVTAYGGHYDLSLDISMIFSTVTLVANSMERVFEVSPGISDFNFLFDAVTDYDGKSYNATRIESNDGKYSQIWIDENLMVTHYSNGDPIPNIISGGGWGGQSQGAYCDYNNSSGYSRLFNWYAVTDSRKLCPIRWHVPNEAEWKTLTDILAGLSPTGNDGGKLKETGTTHWSSPNTGATNVSNFTALPGGYRDAGGTFNGIGNSGLFWSSTEFDAGFAWDRLLSADNGSVMSNSDNYKVNGLSVRCIHDTLTTETISNITINSAQGGGTISQDQPDVAVMGACWSSTLQNPTVSNDHTTTNVMPPGNISDLGNYYAYLTELSANTTYYVRAYFTNSAGTKTTYGNNVVFTTCPNTVATISGATSVCLKDVSPNITFTGENGTAPYTFTYTINGGVNQTVTTNSGNSVTVSVPTETSGTYTYTLVSTYDVRGSSCSQAQSGNVVVTVNQVPEVTDITSTVCSGVGFTVIPANSTNGIVPAGTIYTWAAPIVTGGMTGGASGTVAANISGTLNNPTNVSQTATYTVTPLSGSCIGATFKVTVTVNPTPAISNSESSICSIVQNHYKPLNLINGIVPEGTTYSWPVPQVTGGITGGASGTGEADLNVTLINPTSIPHTAIYTISPKSGSCMGDVFIVEYSVYPNTSIVNMTGVTCSGLNFTVTPVNGVDGIVPLGIRYNWSSPIVTGGMTGGVARGGQTTISGTLINPTSTPQTATYTILPLVDDKCYGATFQVIVTVNPMPSIANQTATTCSGTTFTLTPTDGSDVVPAGTTFSWPLPVVTGAITGGTAGVDNANISGTLINTTNVPQTAIYTITPKSGSCSGEIFTVTVTVYPLLTATINTPSDVTNVLCNGNKTGTINLTVTGGTAPYTYSWSNGYSSEDISQIPAGEYSVTVGDTKGCITTALTTVTEPPPLVISVNSIVNESCTGCKNGSIIINTPTGGVGPYSYSWSGPNYYTSAVQSPDSLSAGVYVVQVTDANACTKSASFEIINPLMVTNTNDAGMGSLRIAIEYANSHAGSDEIIFNIPDTGPFVIQPLSALPPLYSSVSVNGYSQPDASLDNGIQLIVIDGTNAGQGSNGLKIDASGCTVQGLIITGFNGNGIQVTSGTGNRISANSIYDNGMLGIDLGSNGAVTLNDDGDSDPGPNNLQNFPVLSSLSFSLGKVTVGGSLNCTPAVKSYRLEFFASKVADNNDYGEGQTYIGSRTVTTDKKGQATFTAELPIFSKYGDVITATLTDPDGNTSEFSNAMGGLQNQIFPGNNFQYKINGENVKGLNIEIPYETIKNEIDKAYLNWTRINTSKMTFTNVGKTSLQNASAIDGTNLVSFKDTQFPFSPGVLAVSAKTLKLGTNDTEAQIVDADIIFNPLYVTHSTLNFGIADNASYPGFFDIQSLATHEIGHELGLIHSGVYNSTMWFEIGPGMDFRTLEQDDISWLSYRYPVVANYNGAFGSISGNIKYGYSTWSSEPVAGAIVLAINPNNEPVVHAYSDAEGNYKIPGLPPGNYKIYITPLDGDVYGRPLKPENISSYIYCNTIYKDYPGEFYNIPDSYIEDNSTAVTLTLTAGEAKTGINFITNIDKTPPKVVSVVPADDAQNVPVLSSIMITFSEPVDMSTISDKTCFLIGSDGKDISGTYQTGGKDGNSDIVLFRPPDKALKFNSDYTLNITSGVQDLRGNPLDPAYESTFSTVVEDPIPPTIKGTQPEINATGVLLTNDIRVYFSESMIKSTVESSFFLKDVNGNVVECTTSWNEYSTFVLSPKSPLKEGSTYTLNWTNDGTDLFSNKLVSFVPDTDYPGVPYAAPGSMSFATVQDVAPTVLYIEPGSNLTSAVSIETPVVVDFSEPINTSTIDATSFSLKSGTTQVSGNFEFLNDNTRVVFRPGAVLGFSKSYTVTLTTKIADVSLNRLTLASTVTKTFITAAKPSAPHISYLYPFAGTPGAQITIGGYGFDPNPANNKVTFNNISLTGVQAMIKDASLTTITVVVPAGAISGPVRVYVNNTPDDQEPNNLVTYFYVVPLLSPADGGYVNTNTGSGSRNGTMDFNGATAFITNPGENTVSVIKNLDTEDPINYPPFELPTRIQVGTTPTDIVIDPTGTLLYVTNTNSDDVSVISLKEGNTKYQVINTIKVGHNPLGVVASADGRVYVANDQIISVINVDPASGGYDLGVANINTGTRNRDMEITPDGGILVATGDNGVNVIKIFQTNLGFDYQVYNSNPGTGTRNVSISTEAGTAIVTTMAGSILMIDIVPGSDSFGSGYYNYNPPTKPGDGKPSYDGLFYYVTNPDNDLVSIYKLLFGGSGTGTNPSNPAGRSLDLLKSIPVGDTPEGIYLEPDNDKFIVINSGSQTGGQGSVSLIINKPVGEKTVTDLIKDLAITIQDLIKTDGIQSSLGNMLIIKVNDASKNIILKKTKTAINMLKSFIDKVKELDAAGKFSDDYPDVADYMILTAERIISMLQNSGSKSDPDIINITDQSQSEFISVSKLGEIYPNPANSAVTINYEVGASEINADKVSIRIYDISGRLIATLADRTMQPGSYSLTWDGRNENGGRAPYGTYFVLFRNGTVDEVKAIILIN